jgi:glycerol uptake facilitator-like aquaporin
MLAEALGTAGLLAMVVGSGIAAERLSQGNVALALLVNAVASAAGLVVLIFAFGPISGAHFNPVVTLSQALLGEVRWPALVGYWVAQFLGAVSGVVLAHVMLDLPWVTASHHARGGLALWVSEVVATTGLLLTITLVGKRTPSAVPWSVGLFILSAYFFTASTSFANPAVTAARALTDTFAGIRPGDVPGFVVAQLIGVLGATAASWWLARPARARALS